MPSASRPKVLLIGWDAADWKVINPLMDQGLMPNMQALVEGGTMAHIATLHPPLSPMLWTSIATGKRPFRHGIHGFSEPTPNGRGVQPVTNLSRKCKALWNILSQNGLQSVVAGWWPSHPAEPILGTMVSDHYHRAHRPLDPNPLDPNALDPSNADLDAAWPLLQGAVHPPEMHRDLARLRMHPDLLLPEMVQPFIPLWQEIDQDKDKRLAGLMKTLCECVSMHSAATWLIENQVWDFFTVYYDAIDHFCHGFMRYHPPRQAWIPERDFELYSGVISMAYRFHDQMLGVLLHKARKTAGDNLHVIVMSDHGFHPDHLRPKSIPDIPAGPAIEHRDFGIFVANGPRIRKDELLYGASVLDVAPTILALFNLPAGQDMDGEVLSGAFIEPPAAKSVPSWEDVPPLEGCSDGRHPPDTQQDPVAAQDAMEQMIALGYIERPDDNIEKAIEKTVRELRYNLGEAYQDDSRHTDAYEIFSTLYAADRDEQRFAVRLFASCQALGRTREMRTILDDLEGRRAGLHSQAVSKLAEWQQIFEERGKRVPAPGTEEGEHRQPLLTEEERLEISHWRSLSRFQPATVAYLKAQVLISENKFPEALEALEVVRQTHLVRPGPLLQTAELYGRLNRWKEADNVYEKALAVDPDNPHAWSGKARVALRRRRYAAAVNASLEAVQRLYHFPIAHFQLGTALSALKDYERAADAFRVALSQNPNFPAAHRRLALLLERHLGDPAAASHHLRLWRETRVHSRRQAPAPRQATKRREVTPETGIDNAIPLDDCAIIVTGLPRSGTSMIMQMLEAGGLPVLSDGLRIADDDNPRGYLEYEPVRNLARDSGWLHQARGKAIKIVAPLLPHLPPDLPCRVILIERDLNEILNSQRQMLIRRKEDVPDTLERRDRLKEVYNQMVDRAVIQLPRRKGTTLLVLQRSDVLEQPEAAAVKISTFLGGTLDIARMAAAVDRTLHRQKLPDSGRE